MQNELFILFTVIGGAALVPILGRRFRTPSATLEIVYGVLLFNVVLPVQPAWFDLMKEVGLIYLMFIVGMELDLRRFIRQRNFYWYIIIPLLAFAAVPFLFHRLGYPYYLGIAVSMISAGIIIPVLKESGLIEEDLGRDIIGVALTGELMSILILMGVDIHHRYGLTLRAGLEGGKVLVLFGAAALFLRF
ncbi:MAG: cation:proton antiporter, partial [Nitrospiraceae bacterium]